MPRHRLMILLVLLAILAGGMGWSFWIRPRLLLSEAEAQLDSDPRRAALLAEQAVAGGSRRDPDGLLIWCRALLRCGALDEALGCFSLISSPGRLAPEKLIQLAEEAQSLGISLLANLALDAIPESGPETIETGNRLLRLRLQQGRASEVVAKGRQLTAAFPDNAEVWFWLAQGLDQIPNPPEAALAYAAYLEKGEPALTEGRVFALRRLRRLSIDLGDFPKARDCQQQLQSAEISKVAQDAIDTAALAYVDGQTESALKSLAEVLAADPTNSAALELRANIALDRRDDITAEADLRRLLKVSPDNKQAHYQLALLLKRTDRLQEAETHFAENRRLTDLATRILALQGEAFEDLERERGRLLELADVFDQLGQNRTAANYRTAAQQLERVSGNAGQARRRTD